MSKTNETETFTLPELTIILRSIVMHATDDRIKNSYSRREVEDLSVKVFKEINSIRGI